MAGPEHRVDIVDGAAMAVQSIRHRSATIASLELFGLGSAPNSLLPMVMIVVLELLFEQMVVSEYRICLSGDMSIALPVSVHNASVL